MTFWQNGILVFHNPGVPGWSWEPHLWEILELIYSGLVLMIEQLWCLHLGAETWCSGLHPHPAWFPAEKKLAFHVSKNVQLAPAGSAWKPLHSCSNRKPWYFSRVPWSSHWPIRCSHLHPATSLLRCIEVAGSNSLSLKEGYQAITLESFRPIINSIWFLKYSVGRIWKNSHFGIL